MIICHDLLTLSDDIFVSSVIHWCMSGETDFLLIMVNVL